MGRSIYEFSFKNKKHVSNKPELEEKIIITGDFKINICILEKNEF